MRRRVVVRLLYHDHSMTLLGQVLRTNTCSTTTADNYDVGFELGNRRLWWKLNKVEVETFRRLAMLRDARKADDPRVLLAVCQIGSLDETAECPEDGAEGREIRDGPILQDLFADCTMLFMKGNR